jgi:Tripartite tricarboxylate transporter TctB family
VLAPLLTLWLDTPVVGSAELRLPEPHASLAYADERSSHRELMMQRVFRSADFQAGVAFILLAILGIWLSRPLQIGTAVRMGPGYLPTLLSYVLLGLGCATVALATLKPGSPTGAWCPRPLISVVAALVVFSIGIDRLGLFLTTALVVMVASLATPDSRWLGALCIAFGLAVFATVLFINLLGLTIPAWPQIGTF